MLVFELTYPGTWLDYEDQAWSSETEEILNNLRSQFTDANIALNLFLSANEKKPASEAEKEWKRDELRRNAIRRELQKTIVKDHLDYRERIDMDFQRDLIFKREKWNAGSLPREFEYQGILMHARSFLHALHEFGRSLKVLENIDNAPEAVQGAFAKFEEVFTSLQGSEREPGPEKNTTLSKVRTEQSKTIKASTGSVPKQDYLNGTIYGNIMPDGLYVEIDVSPDSMTKVQSVFQEVIDSFRWKGPKVHYPSL